MKATYDDNGILGPTIPAGIDPEPLREIRRNISEAKSESGNFNIMEDERVICMLLNYMANNSVRDPVPEY